MITCDAASPSFPEAGISSVNCNREAGHDGNHYFQEPHNDMPTVIWPVGSGDEPEECWSTFNEYNTLHFCGERFPHYSVHKCGAKRCDFEWQS